MNMDEWLHTMRRFGLGVEAVIGQESVRLRDGNGGVYRFSPHPATLKPAERAMLTRRFLRNAGFIDDADDADEGAA